CRRLGLGDGGVDSGTARLGLAVGVAILGSGLFAALSSASTQIGASANDAIPVFAGGRFAGTAQAQSSVWFRVAYLGRDAEGTLTITYLPVESPRTDLVVYTGSPNAPRAEGRPADRADNTLTQVFSGPHSRALFIQVVNDHQDRAVSFTGRITPTH